MPNAQCPMPNAQCPMPHAPCPMPNAQCPTHRLIVLSQWCISIVESINALYWHPQTGVSLMPIESLTNCDRADTRLNRLVLNRLTCLNIFSSKAITSPSCHLALSE
jgi:hypothetical protein